MEEYEALKIGKSDLMVGWFNAHWSTAGKLFEAEFDKLAAHYPQFTFFKCDVDEVPRAAYDAEVVDSPQISIIPTGSKPDGSLYCKSDMVTVKAQLANYATIVSDAKKAVEGFRFGESPSEKKQWAFDPATGTTIPHHESY
jgi:hypothetical protein